MKATGGRAGKVKSLDESLSFDLSMPKQLGGDGGEGLNPEILFAAGYSACFDSAMRFVARQKKIELTHSEVTAEVGIGAIRGGGFGLKAELKVSLPGLEKEVAEDLMHSAHLVCPYSNATRNNIEVTLTLV